MDDFHVGNFMNLPTLISASDTDIIAKFIQVSKELYDGSAFQF